MICTEYVWYGDNMGKDIAWPDMSFFLFTGRGHKSVTNLSHGPVLLKSHDPEQAI